MRQSNSFQIWGCTVKHSRLHKLLTTTKLTQNWPRPLQCNIAQQTQWYKAQVLVEVRGGWHWISHKVLETVLTDPCLLWPQVSPISKHPHRTQGVCEYNFKCFIKCSMLYQHPAITCWTIDDVAIQLLPDLGMHGQIPQTTQASYYHWTGSEASIHILLVQIHIWFQN